MTKTMSVQVKKCPLRNQPSFLGKVVSTLAYGDQVSVREERASWLHVATGKGEGWTHSSALTSKKIILNPDSREVRASTSSEEIALAGKGFNKQVEQEYRRQNRNVDFTWVDKMEQIVISQTEIGSFLREGGLTAEGGKS